MKDVDQILNRLRELTAKSRDSEVSIIYHDTEDSAELSELVDNLDTILKHGGFLPKAWEFAQGFDSKTLRMKMNRQFHYSFINDEWVLKPTNRGENNGNFRKN